MGTQRDGTAAHEPRATPHAWSAEKHLAGSHPRGCAPVLTSPTPMGSSSTGTTFQTGGCNGTDDGTMYWALLHHPRADRASRARGLRTYVQQTAMEPMAKRSGAGRFPSLLKETEIAPPRARKSWRNGGYRGQERREREREKWQKGASERPGMGQRRPRICRPRRSGADSLIQGQPYTFTMASTQAAVGRDGKTAHRARPSGTRESPGPRRPRCSPPKRRCRCPTPAVSAAPDPPSLGWPVWNSASRFALTESGSRTR